MDGEYAPRWVQSVRLDAIPEQRAGGWQDWHPEEFCALCGHRNIHSWCVSGEDWELARSTGKMPTNEIVCPSCFADLHREAVGGWTTWELRKADPDRPYVPDSSDG